MTAPAPAAPPSAASPSGGGRIRWVDAAKAICILLVVAGHALNNLKGNGYSTGAWEQINLVLGPLRMPLFFLATGIFAAKALAEPWRRFADRRIWVFVWLFVLWVPIREVWLSLIPRIPVGHSGDIPAPPGLDPENWAPMAENIGRSLLGPESYLWFLYALALFAVLSKATRLVPPVVQILLAGAVSVLSPQLDLGWPWNDILHTYVFYLLGMYAASWFHWIARKRSLWIAAVSTAVYAGVSRWILSSYDHFNFGLTGPMKLFLAVVGIIAVISTVSLIEDWRVTAPLIALGSRTLPVFIMHIMVLATVTFLLDLVLPEDPGLPLQPLILGGVAVFLCLALHKILMACGFSWLFVRPQWTRRWYLASRR